MAKAKLYQQVKDCVVNFHIKKLSHFFIYLLFLFNGLKGDGALLRSNGNNLSSDCAQVLDPDATECVCVHVRQTERT